MAIDLNLNDKQKRFCEEYIIDFNATKAAERSGYSPKTAYSQGQRLLKHVEVQEYIRALKDKRAERTDIKADRVLQEIAVLALSRIDDFVEIKEDGTYRLKTTDEIDPAKLGAISSIRTIETKTISKKENEYITTRTEYKLWDKPKSLEMLAKHLGIFAEDNKQRKTDININFTLGAEHANPYIPDSNNRLKGHNVSN